jgi:hypothetical protein
MKQRRDYTEYRYKWRTIDQTIDTWRLYYRWRTEGEIILDTEINDEQFVHDDYITDELSRDINHDEYVTTW